MPGSDEIECKIREILLRLDEDVSADLEAILKAQKERDQRIDDTFDDLFEEIDRLIMIAEDLEEDCEKSG